MANSDVVDTIFQEADIDRDGQIDMNEIHSVLSRAQGISSSKYEATVAGHDPNENANNYKRYQPNDTTTILNDFSNETPIKSSGPEDTNRQLQKLGNNVYVDPNPQVIRRPTQERPLTYEQRILLRCLQPPPLRSVEPLIIKEVRPEQPQPPPPIIIREHGSCTSQPPPLILREKPPAPPVHAPGETVIRHLPPVPLPPRSLVIERFPDCPEKPRDVIIERWLPYTYEGKRPEIVQPAPPPIKYPAPTHTIIIYDAVQPNIVRKVERLGVTQENPEAYIARHGATLLDRDTLLQRARNAGVVEDISCTLSTSAGTQQQGRNVAAFSSSGENGTTVDQQIFSTLHDSAATMRSGYMSAEVSPATSANVQHYEQSVGKETLRYF